MTCFIHNFTISWTAKQYNLIPKVQSTPKLSCDFTEPLDCLQDSWGFTSATLGTSDLTNKNFARTYLTPNLFSAVNTFTHTRVSQSLPVQATPVVNAVIKTQPQQTMPIVQPAPQIPVSIETPLTDQTVITSGGLEASPSLQSKPVPKPILPPQIASPPLQAATPVTSPVTKTPPGAGATYTHPETGTVPPVFHYIPAPPSDIANDKSPEAFTKLWLVKVT